MDKEKLIQFSSKNYDIHSIVIEEDSKSLKIRATERSGNTLWTFTYEVINGQLKITQMVPDKGERQIISYYIWEKGDEKIVTTDSTINSNIDRGLEGFTLVKILKDVDLSKIEGSIEAHIEKLENE